MRIIVCPSCGKEFKSLGIQNERRDKTNQKQKENKNILSIWNTSNIIL